MKYGVYTIRDMVANLSGPLFISRNDQSASRSYRDFMIKEQVPQSEYTLYKLGEYDDEENKLENQNGGSTKINVLLTPSQPEGENNQNNGKKKGK